MCVAFADDKILYIPCDISDRNAVNSAAQQIKQQFGCPSILVNNAGISNFTSPLDIDPARFELLIGVNLKGPVYTCSAFGPDIIKANKGHIVNIASYASFITVASTADYSATKAGLLAYHEGALSFSSWFGS